MSPSHYSTSSASTLASSLSSGSYRSTLSTSTSLDRPYYRSSSTYLTPHSSSLRSSYERSDYRSRLLDSDSKRERKTSLVSEYSRSYARTPNIGDSDSGISSTSRYLSRSDRSESRSRELSASRSDSSKTANSDPLPRNSSGSLSKRNSAILATSAADFYNKYSPANYVPLAQRLSTSVTSPNSSNSNSEISRSKSISNDIGRPPAPTSSESRASRKARNAASTANNTEKNHRTIESVGKHVRSSSTSSGFIPKYKESLPSSYPQLYGKKHSLHNGLKDTNGNEVQQSVAEIRKRFDPKMTVTKLPANDTSYLTKYSAENFMNQLKYHHNGTTNCTRILNSKDEKPVPVHLPSVEKLTNRSSSNHIWELSSSRSNSNNDLSLTKANSEPECLGKQTAGNKVNEVSMSCMKLPKERIPLANVKSQLGINNPIGKILEKSTVIHVDSSDRSYSKELKRDKTNVTSIEIANNKSTEEPVQNDADDKVTPNHTSNFASYIQISSPIATGTSPVIVHNKNGKLKMNNIESPPNTSDSNMANSDATLLENVDRNKLKYIDSEPENDNRLFLGNDIESPDTKYPNVGFENKTFEHENYLMKRGVDEIDLVRWKEVDKLEQFYTDEDESESSKLGVKAMDTSTESTTSDLTEDSSPETPLSRRKFLDTHKEVMNSEEVRNQDVGSTRTMRVAGAGGASAAAAAAASRRSSERESASPTLLTNGTLHGASKSSGLNGLRNIGNTCFMNSVVQCLSNTRPLLEYVSDDRYHSEINTTLSCMKGALIKAFATVIKELWREGERDGVVNTTALKAQVQRFAPRFMGYSQQDAQEFLRYLLEGLHEDVNRVTIKPKPNHSEIDDNLTDSQKATESWQRYLRMEESRVGDIFMGQLKSTLRCTHCSHTSVTFDPFWDLSLPIPSRTGQLKLQQCLAHFTREEELDGDEKPTCAKCGVRRKCLKWFTVQKFPKVLVVHLKRFSPTERFRGKLSVLVDFPLTGLDMGPYAANRGQEATYNLYAVSNHSGTTYSGHYTAYCKHPYNGAWHEYNDSRVSSISPRNVVSSEAYVLFYELGSTSVAPSHL